MRLGSSSLHRNALMCAPGPDVVPPSCFTDSTRTCTVLPPLVVQGQRPIHNSARSKSLVLFPTRVHGVRPALKVHKEGVRVANFGENYSVRVTARRLRAPSRVEHHAQDAG